MQMREATFGDVAAIARVHVESRRTTYKGILPDDYLASMASESRNRLWREILSKPGAHNMDYVAEEALRRRDLSAVVTRYIWGTDVHDIAYGC